MISGGAKVSASGVRVVTLGKLQCKSHGIVGVVRTSPCVVVDKAASNHTVNLSGVIRANRKLE